MEIKEIETNISHILLNGMLSVIIFTIFSWGNANYVGMLASFLAGCFFRALFFIFDELKNRRIRK